MMEVAFFILVGAFLLVPVVVGLIMLKSRLGH